MKDHKTDIVKSLKEKIRLLELENNDWTDRSEDVFLFASTSESLHNLQSKSRIFEALLEKYSVMKDLPYCAIGELKENKINIIAEYASFSENFNLSTITFCNTFLEKLSKEKFLSENINQENDKLNIVLKEANFIPKSIMLYEIENLQMQNGVFISIDKNSFEHFENKKASIEHVITLLNSRLDNLYLMDQLAGQNKSLEEKVMERTSELQESEKKYRQLIEQSNDAIYLLFNNKFEIINKKFTELFGYTVEEVNGSRFNFRNVISKKSLPKIEEQISLFKKGKPIDQVFEVVALKKNKEEIECEVSNTYLDYKNGIATQGIIRDITEKKKRIQELVNAKEEAEKADKLKSEFLAQVSHEIRTPINTILSFASLIKEKINKIDDEEITDSLSYMSNAGRRITRTIDLIINMSQIQSGTLDYNPKKIDINKDLLSNLFLEYKHLALEKQIIINLTSLTNDTFIVVDEYSATQIFHNILDNAVKFTNNGEVLITIERDIENRLIVSITDTGVGINKKYIPNLFKAFTQEEQGYTRRFEGNGLGLALVKKYCNLNNADITVKSKKGAGTTFSVVFNN